MDKYSLAFSISNLGPKSFQKLINEFGNAEKAWEGDRSKYYELSIKDKTFATFDKFRKSFVIEKYVLKLKKQNVKFISFLDKEYPESLKKLEDPPIGIFCKGNVNLLSSGSRIKSGMTKNNMVSIAVVGTRKITNYGKSVTESIVTTLSQNGLCIVSGLALGVDGLSHKVCLDNQGPTIAVMPCGVDCCRPTENYYLYKRILDNNGLIISEYPLAMAPNKGTFLSRNRIVAALAHGILITEAAENSGSLVTADWGFRLSKKVFAVPGPITSRMSDGSLKLLKRGAVLVTCGEDIIQELSIKKKVLGVSKKQILKNLTKEEIRIVKLLENEPMTIDEILKNTKLQVGVLFGIISSLEIKGVLHNKNGKIENNLLV